LESLVKIKLKKKKLKFLIGPRPPNIPFLPQLERINFGILNVTTDETIQWVKNCRTGWSILRQDAELLGKGEDGEYYWKRKGEKVPVGLKSYASTWKEGEMP